MCWSSGREGRERGTLLLGQTRLADGLLGCLRSHDTEDPDVGVVHHGNPAALRLSLVARASTYRPVSGAAIRMGLRRSAWEVESLAAPPGWANPAPGHPLSC